jgi:uncharacterized protein YbaR (Trm112 family)
MMARMPSDPTSAVIAISPELLKILRCPLTRSALHVEGDRLVAERGGLRYPIRNGIPVLLVEEAELPAGVASLEALKTQLGL